MDIAGDYLLLLRYLYCPKIPSLKVPVGPQRKFPPMLWRSKQPLDRRETEREREFVELSPFAFTQISQRS